MTDPEWAELLRGSPKKAYEQLISSFGGLVYAIVAGRLSCCGSKSDIEDCVSDVFVEAFRSADRFSESSGSMKTYISTIARRRAIDAFRSISREMIRTQPLDGDDELIDDSSDTVDETERRLQRDRLWEAVRSLGEPDSTIIVGQYVYCLTAADLAKRLSMSTAAVQKRSQRAREKIRRILDEGDY